MVSFTHHWVTAEAGVWVVLAQPTWYLGSGFPEGEEQSLCF